MKRTIAPLLFLAFLPAEPRSAAAEPMPFLAYAWPTSESKEPTDEEWSAATELEPATAKLGIDGVPPKITCTQRVVREWLRITCTPPHDAEEDVLLGVVWGIAGDVGKVKAKIPVAAGLERYKKPSADPTDQLTRRMGAEASVTLRLAPGSAVVLGVDRIGWGESYDGSIPFSRPGLLLDVSWAEGEAAPTVAYR